MKTFQKLLISGALALAAMAAHAEPQSVTVIDDADGQPLRVGGNYTVAKIDKVAEGAFVMEFTSDAPTGKFDTLTLESDHVHVAVKVGQKIRLSAEILSTKGASAEVAQMVIFLPHVEGPVPVWLLSNKAPNLDLRSTKYLQMHNPLNDYTIM